jgi:hypothetical protein
MSKMECGQRMEEWKKRREEKRSVSNRITVSE